MTGSEFWLVTGGLILFESLIFGFVIWIFFISSNKRIEEFLFREDVARNREKELLNRLMANYSSEFVAMESQNPVPVRRPVTKMEKGEELDPVESMLDELMNQEGYSSKGVPVD